MECPRLAGFAAPLAMTNGPGFCSVEEIKKGNGGGLKIRPVGVVSRETFHWHFDFLDYVSD